MTERAGAAAIAWRYALAAACIGVAVGLHLSPLGLLFHPTGLFIFGVVAAAWFGGAGPGIFAAFLSAIALPPLITDTYPLSYPLFAGLFDLPRFITLGLTGAAVGWGTSSLRRAQGALRERERELTEARDELETAVAVRTANLAESEERYARAMEATAAGHWEWDLVTHQVFHSPRFRELYGIGLDEEFADRDAWKARQPIGAAERARQEEALQAAIDDPTKPYDIELSFEVRPGEVRWLRSRGKVFRDDYGRPLRIAGATTDITAQKLAQEALRRSEERYARVMLAAQAGFWDWDVLKDHFYVSPRLLEMCGFPPGTTFSGREDFIRRAPFYAEDRDKYQEAVKQLFASGGSRLTMEVRSLLDGETVWNRLDGICFRDEAGRVVRWTGSATDVTEQERAEEALRLSEQRYARVMQASEDGFWEWIVASDEFYASPRMLAIYGLPPDTLFRGRADFLSRFPFYPKDLALWRASVAAHLAGVTERIDTEVRAKVGSETRWLRLTGICQRDASGAEVRWTGSVSDVTERRQAQEALRRSEERYARAMEGSDAGHWDWNIVSDEMFVSERAREMLALPADPLPARRSEIMARVPMHPEDRATMAAAVAAGIRTGVHERDYRVIPRPGEMRWLRTRAKIYRDARGAAVRMTGSLIDITERKLAAEALRLSEQRYARAMDAAEAGHWEWNVATDEVFVSDRQREMLELPTGLHFANREAYLCAIPFHPEDRATFVALAKRHIDEAWPRFQQEFRVVVKGGETRWMRLAGKSHLGADGKPAHFTGSLIDVTEAKLAADALRESEERYALAVAGSDDGVWDVDFVERRVFISAHARELIGMPPGPATLPMEEFLAALPLHPEDVPGREVALRAHLSGEAPAYEGEFRLRQLDGTYRWRRIHGLCVRDADGQPLRMAGSISDVDARRRAEEALRLSEGRYALAMQVAEEGHWDWNVRTDEIFDSTQALRMLGLPLDTQYRTRADLLAQVRFHPDDWPRISAEWREALAGRGADHEFEYRILRGQEPRSIRSRWKIFRDAHGAAERVIGVLADITERKLAEEALLLSEERYALAMRASDAGHWDWKIPQDEFYASPRYLEFAGFPPDLLYSTRDDIVSRIPFHPDDRPAYEAAVLAHFTGETPRLDVVVRVVPHGQIRWLHVIGMCLRDDEGRPARWAGSVADITERMRAEALLAGEKQLLEMMARATPLSTVLDALCRIVEENLSGCLCGISLVDATGTRLDNGAAPSLPPGYVEAIADKPMERDAGPCCTAAVLGEQVISADVGTDTRWPDWRELALSHGLRSIWSTPIVSSAKKALGTFAIYFTQPSSPTDEQLAIIERFSHVAAVAIERSHAEEDLRRSQHYLAEAQKLSHSGSWAFNASGFQYWSAELFNIHGLAPGGKAPSLPEYLALVHPEDREFVVREIEQTLAGAEGFDFTKRIVRPDGAIRHVRCVGIRATTGGTVPEFVGTGMDVTERDRAEEALRLSEQRYALAMEASEEGHFDWNVQTDEIFASAHMKRLLDLPADGEFRTRNEMVAHVRYYPGDRERLVAMTRQVLASSALQNEFEYRLLRGDRVHWLRARWKIFRDAAGAALRVTGVLTDITERRLAEALQSGEKRILEGVAKGEPLRQVLDDLCRLVEELAPGVLASILLLEGNRLRHGGAPSLPQAYTDAIDGAAIGPSAGSCGTAAYRGEQVIVSDIATDVLWADYRAAALPYGLRACWSTPVFSPEGKVIATFAMYYREPRSPSAQDQQIIEQIGHLAGVAIQHKLAAGELRESEARFRALTALWSDWYWRQDEELRFTYSSAPGDWPDGSRRSSSIGLTRWEIPGIVPLSSAWAEHRELLAARKPFRDLEYSRPSGDGTTRYVSSSGTPIFDEKGEFRGYQGVARDITERKRFDEELRSRKESLELALKSARAVPWQWISGADPQVNRWSPELAAMFGVQPSAFDGTVAGWWNFCHPDDVPRIKASIAHTLASGEIDVEYRVVHPDGKVHWLNQKGRAFFDAHGKPKRSIGFMFDVTERRKAEDDLRSRQEMLELAQKSARAIAFEWKIGEGEGENRWSPDLEAMYGFAPGAYDGTFETWKKLVHPEDWPRVKEAIGHAQRTGEVASEYRVVHADGSVHWLQARGRMFSDAAGNPARMIGFMQDVTQRKQAEQDVHQLEQKLRRSQRLEAMGTLAGGIAHDFNNILGAIVGYGEMALRDAKKGTRLRRDLDAIMAAGERGRSLVDRILAFSRSGVGERVPVDVEEVVREALDQLAVKLPENVTIAPRLRAGRAAMLGDSTQVHQVVMNLTNNAVQAMPKGGVLRVSLESVAIATPRAALIGSLAPGEYLVLKVADAGSGIAPDVLERMFDPFFTTKEVGVGSGLGLSLVHGIVANVGGAIDVATELGKGSTFTVYLPRSGDAPAKSVDENRPLPRGEGQRVLVVDDEEPLVRLATETLERLGYEPVGFTSSSAALAAFRADPQRFDALLTDERMPGMSGTALIREVRGIRDALPVVLMSGYLGMHSVDADVVVRKPVSASELAASMARALHP